MNQPINQHPASFRDPSGFVYEHEGKVYRFVSTLYKEHYDKFQQSGLADELRKKQLLLPFTEVADNHTGKTDWYKTLEPQQLQFISYAWEWSFEQLKDAALATLSLCNYALQKGMILKDATPSNIQLVDGKCKLIDTLSFETYTEGQPWIAYRQFCECFLNPLLVTHYTGVDIHRLELAYPDGMPAAVASTLLPFKTKLKPIIYLHVHLQAKISGKQRSAQKQTSRKISKKNIEQILESLRSCIVSLSLPEQKTTWNNYYTETILSNEYLSEKKALVSSLLQELNYTSVLDLGANEGEFSLLCKPDAKVIATDFDSSCINNLYKKIRQEKRTNISPLVIDLTYPSPSMGWMNEERKAFFSRTKVDVCLALALIHHLAIAKNISFEQLAAFFASVCNTLIIEFVPKDDPKVKELLTWREDIFEGYNVEEFEKVFQEKFSLLNKIESVYTKRILFVYQKK
ncbi:MAG: class I SAM-dependent methyltransferase [Chitinophagaceae bacterium]|nr:class I SAM-dependent methyltransferase [Chitinophagaceae bacterium]